MRFWNITAQVFSPGGEGLRRESSHHGVVLILDLNKMHAMFGKGDDEHDMDDKTTEEWVFRSEDDRIVTLYDYKGSKRHHIGSCGAQCGDAAQAFDEEFGKFLSRIGVARFPCG